MAIWIKTGLRNHDIIIESKGIRAINRVPLFWKNTFFSFLEINSVHAIKGNIQLGPKPQIEKLKSFFSESSEKYILIKTKDQKTYRFNCYGMEEDYYDENLYKTHFDDLKERLRDLKKMGIIDN